MIVNYYNLVKIDGVLLQIIRDFNPSYFVTDGSNQMNQKLIGLWVEYLGGDRVVRQNDRILICETVEEIEWEEVN
jgi:hypothetical protein|tara:strand:- start:1883 stop:2107 length:225 start_codon:yes stop_codon:yes gene_type:complete